MKLSKKVLAAFSVAAALAMAGTFVGCSEDDEDPYDLIEVSGDDATIDKANDGTLTTNDDDKTATSATYVRGFKTPKTTGWKAAVYKLSINKSSNGGVMGWVFDEDEKQGTSEKEYSFYLLGLKATSTHPSIYLSRFNDVVQSGLTGSGTTFGTEYTMIDSGLTSNASSGSKWYYQLSDISYDNDTGYADVWVAFKQVKKNGRYAFGVFSTEANATAWYASNGEYTGDEMRLVTSLNAVNGDKFTSQFKKIGDTEASDIDDFGVTADKAVRDKQVGFYAMIPAGGTLKGSFKKIDRTLADEVVEE